ncbi:MAG: PadR family transcriptional regulator [Ilumatobacteraceae bacterium]
MPAPDSSPTARTPGLTTSSYAVLGLLALRPWSAYELTQQAARSLRFAWPKSERLLYAEPKKLVRHRLASVDHERVGKRTRAIYTITADGRAALGAGASTRPAPPMFEVEALVRVLFAENGTLDDLHAALDQLASDAADLREQVVTINSDYLDGGHPFPERTHLSVLFATFQLELFDLVARWVEFAKTEIEAWPAADDPGPTDRILEILEIIGDRRPVLDALADRTPG